jgi:uncharacterized protein YjbI with pentapeptide repeats
MPRPALTIAPEAPDLPDELPAAGLEASTIENGDSWSQVRVAGASLPTLTATGLSFREAVLARLDVTGGRLINLSFTDVELDACSLATVDARSGAMRRVVARGCRMTGLLWTEGGLRDVVLRAVRFVDCDLTGADLTGARLAHCELLGCTLDDLRGTASLRGSRMPWPDILAAAGTFAEALGVGVLDADDRL